jgi:hypothetical protein
MFKILRHLIFKITGPFAIQSVIKSKAMTSIRGRRAVSEVVSLEAWTSLADKLVRLGYEIAGSAGPEVQRNDDDQGDIRLMAASLIARSLSNITGTLAMVGAKRIVEARVLARCILENQFWMAGFASDPNKFRQALIDDDLNRKGLKGRTLFETGEIPDYIEQRLRQWMRANKEWNKSKSITPKQVARGAQVGEAYVFYDFLSTDAHPTIFTLNRYVEAADGQHISGIALDPGPTEAELADTVGLACFGLVSLLAGGCTILRSAAADRVDVLAREYLELMRKEGRGRRS